MITVAPANRAELPDILALLEESELPAAGVEDHAEAFLVARDDGRLVGCIGLEAYGDVGLLRSLAVCSERRGGGLGQRLVAHLLDEARERGMTALYLLTTTADRYFPRFGFETIPRDEADSRLSASEELRGACPDTAVCMRLRL